MSAHALLRAATRAAHDRVDSLFSNYNLGRHEDYGRFLTAQAAAFLAVEAALDRAGAGDLFPGWTGSRRSHLLRADLAALGLEEPPSVPTPDLHSVAAVAGAAYVLEGSRLGGAMLARAVPPALPSQFLAASHRAGQWRTFLARLDQLLPSEAEQRAAVAAATKTFEAFADAAGVPTVAS